MNVSFRDRLWVAEHPRLLKGFGCRQAYESLSCRNPRAAGDFLWGFVPRGVPAAVANFRIGCGGDVVGAASRPDRRACSVDSDGTGVRDDRRHGNVHITFRRPAPAWRGRTSNLAMPGHGALPRFGALEAGGARGWHHRSNLSMTTMRPPQQGQGGRTSAGSSGVSSSGGGATFSSSRATARLALRAELASSP